MAELETSPENKGSDVDFVALPPGEKIGRYEVLSVLGQGGFGITYRARDIQLGREVAIKEYLPTSLAVRQNGATVLPRSTKVAEDFTWGRDRFVAEGRTLATLHDAPAIVRVFDFLEINGTAYIVMELVRGETLDDRLKKTGKLSAGEVEAILWPLLDGLEQVHNAGFLHRDIKPANILLRADGRPTLIDFGASRAAMAGRTTAMTAIFTPGFAAAEQFTSAKQGPWTDIYGLSATIYSAIAGAAPPSAFERMLDDDYQPLTQRMPPGFSAGLLIGIDAGLAVRSAERPQSIAGWRPLLGHSGPADTQATVAISKAGLASAPARVAPPPAVAETTPPVTLAPAKSRTGLYAAAVVALLVALAGGGYFAFAPAPKPVTQVASVQDMKLEELERILEERRKANAEAAEKRRLEEEAQRKATAEAAAKRQADIDLEQARINRQKAEEELAKLKAEMAARRVVEASQREQSDATAKRAAEEDAQRKAEAEMAALRQAEDDARKKAVAETESKRQADEALAKAQAERRKADQEAAVLASKQKSESDTKQQAEAEAKQRLEDERKRADTEAKLKADGEAKQKAEAEAERKAADAAETGLRLAVPDRQRIQVALTSLGFDTRGTDGAFGPRSRDMVAAWQKARNQPATGYFTGTQHQALLREAAPALQKYDEQKKAEENKKKLEEDKKKAEEEAKPKTAALVPAAPSAAASTPPPPAAAAAPPGGGGEFDGVYGGTLTVNAVGPLRGPRPTTVRIASNAGSGTMTNSLCGESAINFRVAPTGDISGDATGFDSTCSKIPLSVRGRVANRQIQINMSGVGGTTVGTLVAR